MNDRMADLSDMAVPTTSAQPSPSGGPKKQRRRRASMTVRYHQTSISLNYKVSPMTISRTGHSQRPHRVRSGQGLGSPANRAAHHPSHTYVDRRSNSPKPRSRTLRVIRQALPSQRRCTPIPEASWRIQGCRG